MRRWYQGDLTDSPLKSLNHLSRGFQQSGNGVADDVTVAILDHALARLETEHNLYGLLLTKRFREGEKVLAVANELNISESRLHEIQRSAVERLTELLQELEMEAYAEHCEALHQRLTLPYDETLVGLEDHLRALIPVLLDDESASIVAIEGISGVGKTALTSAIVQNVIYHSTSWANVACVNLRRKVFHLNGQLDVRQDVARTTGQILSQIGIQLFSALPEHHPSRALISQLSPNREELRLDVGQLVSHLQRYLKVNKCILIIEDLDELESIEPLLAALLQLVDPTKVILTSRKSFYDVSGVYHYQLSQLSSNDALALLHAEAAAVHLHEVADADSAHLIPVFDILGGNPLAIRFFVRQLQIYGLHEILDDLREARGDAIVNLYHFLFGTVWEELPDAAQAVLFVLCQGDAAGITLGEIQKRCDLPYNEIRGAVKQLVMLNLVDIQGGFLERRYMIHNLTRTFVGTVAHLALA